MAENNKKYNTTIAPLKKTSKGFMSRVVDEKLLESLKGVELGGRLFISIRSGEDENGNPTEYGYLESADKAAVDAFKARTGNYSKGAKGNTQQDEI